MKLIIVGAGSSGLGVALAAARRGWSVLLLEAQDIGGGTSTTSTKLVHGGVRYLESAVKNLRYADWKLVREALQERAWMLRSHPQLAKPLPLVVPVRQPWERLYYGLGLWLYELLSGSQRVGATHWLNPNALYTHFPTLRTGFVGGWQYWDGQFEDRLYAVHLALFLRQRYGVEVRTHARVVSVRPTKSGIQVEVETASGLRYEEEGDWLINATGPWSDELRRLVQPGVPARLRLSRGSHLVVPRSALPIEAGFLIPRTEDGRLLFVLPWKEDTVLVGTTEVEEGQPAWKVPVSAAEEAYLRAYVARYFEVSEPLPVQARFAGYRPLVAAGRGPSARLARRHVIEVWPHLRFVSLLGGKWTTFRAMGEDTLQALASAAGWVLPPGEPVECIVPDLSELEALCRAYPQPAVPGEAFCEGEVRFWRRLGWAQSPQDVVEGRWQLHLIDEQRAQRAIAALQARWDCLD